MSRLLFPPPPPVVSCLHGAKHLWLATHVRPDHDGFGSMLATGLGLATAGRRVEMVYAGDGPTAFAELPGFDRTVAPADLTPDPDALVVFDCHEPSRIHPEVAAAVGDVPVVVVDHHVAVTTSENPLVWIDASAPATACLAHSLLLAMGVEPDAGMATNLYAALLTDTGGFRFPNTGERALRCAAELAAAGADVSGLAERLLHRRRAEGLALTAEVLGQVRYHAEGAIALLTVTREQLARTGARREEAEGITGFLTSTDGVRFVAFLREEDPGWQVSLRAVGDLDVQAIALEFGGGGHRLAAGFEWTGSREDLEAALLPRFRAALGSG